MACATRRDTCLHFHTARESLPTPSDKETQGGCGTIEDFDFHFDFLTGQLGSVLGVVYSDVLTSSFFVCCWRVVTVGVFSEL